jgi:hypothetical protein
MILREISAFASWGQIRYFVGDEDGVYTVRSEHEQ